MATKVEAASSQKIDKCTPVVQFNELTNLDCPLTPIRQRHVVKKTELQYLNDRLALYLDIIRRLENENERLQSLNESHDSEMANVKQMYEGKLSTTRELVGKLASEKAKLEIDAQRLWDEKENLKKKCEKIYKRAKIAQNNALLFEAKFNESNNIINETVAEHKKSIAVAENMKIELVELRKQLVECQAKLQNEIGERIDSENIVRSLRKEVQFKDQIHREELNESRTRRQLDTTEQYETKLRESLQEIRDQYEERMHLKRQEIESLFATNIKIGQNSAQNDDETVNVAQEMNLRVIEMERTNFSLNNHIRDLQLTLDGEHNLRIEAEAETKRLREELVVQLKRYQDLNDINISCDLEHSAYKKLLCCEDDHFNITLNSNSATSLSPSSTHSLRESPAAKRKRSETFDSVYNFVVTSSSAGDVEITEIDPAGKFIKLRNKSQNEVPLGGWQLFRKVGSSQTEYKFDCSVKLEGSAELVIWSVNSGISASPGNIITELKWFVAETIKVTLMNGEDMEEASAERIRQQCFSGQIPQKNDQKCIIM